MITKTLWTYTLTDSSIDITEDLGLSDLSICVISGAGKLLSTGNVGGIDSTYINLLQGVSVNLSSGSNAILTGLKIQVTGELAIIGR